MRPSRRARPAPAPAPPRRRYPPAGSAAPAQAAMIFGWRSSSARSSSANPPSGPIRMSMPLEARLPPFAAPAADRRPRRPRRRTPAGALPARWPRKRSSGNGLGDLGEAEDAALLGGLDHIGAHPLAVDPRDLGEAGQNRLQSCRAHLDRLLHHVVEPGMLQRREHIGDVGQAVLRPGLGDDRQAVRPLAARDLGLPFAVAAVEHQNRCRRRQAAAHCRDSCSGSARARPSGRRPRGRRRTGAGARKSSSGMCQGSDFAPLLA